VDFEIVKEENKVLRILLTTLVCLVLFALFFFLVKEEVSFLAGIIFNLASSFTFFEKLKYKKTGVFKITDSSIELKYDNSEKIIINKKGISEMIICHKCFDSKNIFQRRSGGLIIDIINQGEKMTCKLYVRSRKNRELFKERLKELYKQSVKIKEVDGNGIRSFLFKSNLTYKEIQRIKTEFNMNWV